jgi:predicted Ser/Thr protein kinase
VIAALPDSRVSPELEAWIIENLQSQGTKLGEGYQAEVHRLSIPAGEIVVKSTRPKTMLRWLARYAIRREYRIYQCLVGIAGIPSAHGLIAGDQLVLDYVEGAYFRTEEFELTDRETFFARLLETILAMHAAGVAHGDLKRKANIVIATGEIPYILDFGIARVRGTSAVSNYVFNVVRQIDLNSWIKLKYGRWPAELPACDAAIYKPLAIEKFARRVRIPWQKITLRRPRQRLRRWLRERARND